MAGVGTGIEAGKAFVEYVLDDSKLDGQLGKITQKLNRVANIGLIAGGALESIFAGAALTFANVGGELFDLSTKTGLTVENLSELKFAAEQSGIEFETLQKALKELQANGIDPIRFDEIAADINQLPDATSKARAAMTFFGAKAGQALLPLIQELPQLRQQARDFAVTISTRDATAAHELGSAFGVAKDQVVALAFAVGGAIAGPLTEFLHWTNEVVANVITWIHNNPELISGIGKLTVIMLALAAALKAVAIAAAIAEYFTNPIAALAATAGAVVAATYIESVTSGSSAAIATPAAPASAGTPLHESASEIVDRLDKLINLARQGGTVAGVG